MKISRFFSDNIVSLFKNASWKFGSNTIDYLCSFIKAIFLARFLGVEKYGLFMLVIAVVTIVNKIVDVRIWEATIKYLSEYIGHNDRPRAVAVIKLSYLIDFITGLIAFLIIFMCSGLISRYLLKHPDLQNLIFLYSFTLLIQTVEYTSSAIHRVYVRYRRLSFIEAFTALNSLVFVLIALFYLEPTIVNVLWAYIIASILNNVVVLISAINIVYPDLKIVWSVSSVKLLKSRYSEMAYFLFHTSFNNLITLFTQDADVVILNYFHGPSAVGIYKVAKKMARSLHFFITPIYFVLYPKITSLFLAKKIKEARKYIFNLTTILLILALPVIVCIFIFAKPLLLIMFGNDYLLAQPSLRIMIWGMIVMLPLMWVRPVFLAVGKPQILTWINLLTSITMFFLSLVLVPKYGYIASSLMYLYYIYVYYFGSIVFLKKYMFKLNIGGIG